VTDTPVAEAAETPVVEAQVEAPEASPETETGGES
jgi:hypothetical protein